MKLLLLLSALLSALTGAGEGARPAQAAVAVTRTAEALATAQLIAPRESSRPVAPPPGLTAVASIDRPAYYVAPAAPLYLSRRRE